MNTKKRKGRPGLVILCVILVLLVLLAAAPFLYDAVAGFDESLLINQTQATLDTICTMLGWIPAIISLLMLLIIWKLDTKKEMAEAKEAYEKEFGPVSASKNSEV